MKPFPPLGATRTQINALLDGLLAGDAGWREGRVPLYVFQGDAEAYEVGRDAFFRFFSENALGARRAFGSVRKMEEDIIAMGLSLFNGHPGMAGVVTSGGTERGEVGARDPVPQHQLLAALAVLHRQPVAALRLGGQRCAPTALRWRRRLMAKPSCLWVRHRVSRMA